MTVKLHKPPKDLRTVLGTAGATSPGQGVLITGDDSGTVRKITTDADGHLQVDVLSGGGGSSTDDSTFTSGSSSFSGIGGATGGADDDDLGGGQFGMVRMTSARAIHVHLVNGGAGGSSQGDDSAFTSGTSNFNPIGGFTEEADSEDLGGGQGGAVRMTSARAMHVHLVNGGAGGTSQGDDSAFTSGTTSFNPIGGFTGEADTEDLGAGVAGWLRMTSARSMHVHITNAPFDVSVGKTEVTVAGQPVAVSLAGAPEIDVSAHAFITNVVGVSGVVRVTGGPVDVSVGKTEVTIAGGEIDASVHGTVAVANNVLVRQHVNALMNGASSLAPKYAVIAATGNNTADTIVATVAGAGIRVVSMFMTVPVTSKFIFRDGDARANSGTMPMAHPGGFVLPPNPYGWFETSAGESLQILITEDTTANGMLTYVEI